MSFSMAHEICTTAAQALINAPTMPLRLQPH